MVTAIASGGTRAEVKTGSLVTFGVIADTPPGGCSIIGADWDLDGTADFAHTQEGLDGSATSIRLTTAPTFDTLGTYFPAVRVHSCWPGFTSRAISAGIENPARVRVVVT